MRSCIARLLDLSGYSKSGVENYFLLALLLSFAKIRNATHSAEGEFCAQVAPKFRPNV